MNPHNSTTVVSSPVVATPPVGLDDTTPVVVTAYALANARGWIYLTALAVVMANSNG